jgi:thiamine kinase-like enzyme
MPPGSAAIDDLLDRVPALTGRPRTVRELPGGLTNRNYHVITPDGGYVARVWSAGSELLAIDRDCEYRNSVTAAEAGAGAPVIDYRPGDGILVIGYIDGVTFTNEDVAKPGNLTRIADAVRTLHAGGRFGNDFNMFEIQARYAGVTAEAGMRIPDGYHGLRPQFEAMRAALAVRDEGTVPCNNDLLAANFIDDGQKIWLIDYEYAGNNDACFELGNIAGGVPPARRRPRRAGHRLLRPPGAAQDRPGPAAGPGRDVRLDAVGRDPARGQPDRLRLLGVGDGTLGRRRRGPDLSRFRGPAGRGGPR